jgi:hypothetical protein
MREKLLAELREIARRLDEVNEEILSEQPCRAFSALRSADGGKSVKLSGNSEGLAHLALYLIGLAVDRNPGQHFHFDDVTTLDVAELELILMYEPATWDRH